jgi:hypothetical protein
MTSPLSRACVEYLKNLICEGEVHTLLLDNFPGSVTQVKLLLSALRQLVPGCIVQVTDLVADPDVLRRRAGSRRVEGIPGRGEDATGAAAHIRPGDPRIRKILGSPGLNPDPGRCFAHSG